MTGPVEKNRAADTSVSAADHLDPRVLVEQARKLAADTQATQQQVAVMGVSLADAVDGQAPVIEAALSGPAGEGT